MDGILKNCSMPEPNMWIEEDILKYVNANEVFCNKSVSFDNIKWYVHQYSHKYLSTYKLVVLAICYIKELQALEAWQTLKGFW